MKKNTRIDIYESAAAFVDAAARFLAADPPKTQSGADWHNHGKRDAEKRNPDKFGRATFPEIPGLAFDKPRATIEKKAREYEERIEEGETATAPRSVWTPADEGELSPARIADALAGSVPPHFFTARRRLPAPARLATVIFNASLSWGYEAEDFARRGALVAAASDALEARGYSVALYVETGSDIKDGRKPGLVCSLYPAKRHGEPLDLSAVWYAVRPEVTRRASFVNFCRMHGEEGNTFDSCLGCPRGAGKEELCRRLDIPTETAIYIPAMTEDAEMERIIFEGVAAMIEEPAA